MDYRFCSSAAIPAILTLCLVAACGADEKIGAPKGRCSFTSRHWLSTGTTTCLGRSAAEGRV